MECPAPTSTYVWCAFSSEYPGEERYPVSITKDNEMYVWQSAGIVKLDIALAKTGQFMGGEDAELDNYSGMWQVQYSLIAAAIFVMTTVCILYSNS